MKKLTMLSIAILLGVLLIGLATLLRHPARHVSLKALPVIQVPPTASTPHPGEILLSFAGDCTFGSVNGDGGPGRFPSVYRRSRLLDYPFARVQPWFRNDDLTVVNFECTLTDAVKTANKQWRFKGPARYAAIFPAGSVEAVGLSNNHAHDYLQAGFEDTRRAFRNAHVAAFYQNVPYVTNLKGIQTVLIGDCTVVGENTTQTTGVAERVLAEIRRVKKPDNIVIVVMHWGSELDPTPRPHSSALAASDGTKIHRCGSRCGRRASSARHSGY